MDKRRCCGCMRLKTKGVCEHCGWDENNRNGKQRLTAGTELDERYVAGRVLGQGCSGITYLGWDKKLAIPVVIKEYFPSGLARREASTGCGVIGTGEDGGARFRNNTEWFLWEARTLARFQENPQIARVLGYFQQNGTAYTVAEYDAGIPLGEYVRRNGGKLSIEETLELLRPFLEALDSVHKTGIIHRDVRPENIRLSEYGNIRLVDFSTLRDVPNEDETPFTKEPTPYAPPEQIQERGAVGPWTDVYGLCETIYHCLTGDTPPSVRDRQNGAQLEWELLGGLTEAQCAVLQKGTELDIQERPASLEQLFAELYGYPMYPPAEKTEDEEEEQPEEAEEKEEEKKTEPEAAQIPEKKPEKPEKEPARKNTSMWMALLAVLASAVMLVVGIFIGRGMDRKEVQVEQPVETEIVETTEAAAEETEPAEPAWAENVMMSDATSNSSNSKALRSAYSRNKIITVTFLDDVSGASEDAWDVSEAENGTVLAWVTPNGNGYDMYIAGDGGVAAPANCGNLFRWYTNLESVNFNGCFHTENTTDMNRMFSYCSSLTGLGLESFRNTDLSNPYDLFNWTESLGKLDMSGLDTSGVMDMSYMFNECKSLEKLDMGGMDTSGVTDMNSMFANCSSLVWVDLSGFDTSNVTNMCEMFSKCESLPGLDLRSFRTGNVTTMDSMFYGCKMLAGLDLDGFRDAEIQDFWELMAWFDSLTNLDLSSFDMSSVKDVECMFKGCDKIDQVWIGNFDISNVKWQSSFAPGNFCVNGKPWGEWFWG